MTNTVTNTAFAPHYQHRHRRQPNSHQHNLRQRMTNTVPNTAFAPITNSLRQRITNTVLTSVTNTAFVLITTVFDSALPTHSSTQPPTPCSTAHYQRNPPTVTSTPSHQHSQQHNQSTQLPANSPAQEQQIAITWRVPDCCKRYKQNDSKDI